MIREAIAKMVDGGHLTEAEAEAAMNEIMSGEATPAQVGAFITALRMKGETVDEITGCARVMRRKARTISPREGDVVVDTCGTGGDGANTFNISTTAAFIVAGAGISVAKHGNRSVSSKCGSADVLEALGAHLDLEPDRVQQCLHQTGIAFLFAPAFHQAMKHAVGPRREIGVRTVFNILGPLTNPAGAHAQVVGVYDARLTEPLARVLAKLGVRNAFVVHGLDGLDEISLAEESQLSQVVGGEVRTYKLAPEQVGLKRAPREAVAGGSAEENAATLKAVLSGEKGPRRDIAVLNAAAALVAAGRATTMQEGVQEAQASIDTGRAAAKLEEFIAFTRN